MTTTEIPAFHAIEGLLSRLEYLQALQDGSGIVQLRLNRPAKRNAANDQLIAELHTAFINLPRDARAVVITGAGEHFCAGLDLAEVTERSVGEGIVHSRTWHAAFEQIQFGPVPVIAALHGAVVGGGLELAASAHIRVADRTAFFALPEGQRGIFVGGGGSARLPRLMGVTAMTDMMLTGRVLTAEEGLQLQLCRYLVEPGQALAKALELTFFPELFQVRTSLQAAPPAELG